MVKNRYYCHTCNFLFSSEDNSDHKDHDINRNFSDFYLNHPTQLLHLKTSSKGESQFIFSKASVDVIINGLKKLNIKNVLCLGVPSIYEQLRNDNDITSILLDIDDRYIQFFDDKEFCWFNMLNFHFFVKSDNERIEKFLSTPDSVLIMDPPFSARAEPLQYTLSKFNNIFQKYNNSEDLPVIWTFPYFKEQDVLKSFPGMKMLDYGITYLNQNQFTGNKVNKVSAVRIFTNLDASKFIFPTKEGYHFCSSCNRSVSKLNKHCHKCGICPSKNGQSYKHCSLCSRCVKNSWQHCETCRRCTLPEHQCQDWQDSPKKFKRKRRADNIDLQTENQQSLKKQIIMKRKTKKIRSERKKSLVKEC